MAKTARRRVKVCVDLLHFVNWTNNGNLSRPSGLASHLVAPENASGSPGLPRQQQTVGDVGRQAAIEEWRAAMKELRNLRRGWAGRSASLSPPARKFLENHNDRLDKCPLRAHSVRIAPSAVSHPRVVRSPVVFLVATRRWPPVRCAAGLVLLWGAEAREDRHLGALKVVFCRHLLDSLADWWGLQRHCGCIGGRGLFAPQHTIPGPRGRRGHTCRTLPRADSVSQS